MLSRSNSNAVDRIRRAKSTSSTHTTSSGPRPVYLQSDPFVTRQQAEIAALEAFYRAQQQQQQQQPDTACPEYRAVACPKLERRRSRTSGRTEGGHFEETRLGRRKSRVKRDDSAASRASPTRRVPQSQSTSESYEDEKVIIRKRSVIPPNSSAPNNYSLPSSSSRHVRKSQAEYKDGSPVQRNSSAFKEQRSTFHLNGARNEQADAYRSNISTALYWLEQDPVPVPATQTQALSTGETQTGEEAVALARDRCLQDFQQKKVRERKSFILGPLQKRKSSNFQHSSSNDYDKSLPPFNYADESMLPPPPPLPRELPVLAVVSQHEKKSRNFSESLKGRLKKVFRRTSRIPTELPAQQIEGKHFYFTTDSTLSAPEASNDTAEDPFVTSCADYQLTAAEPKLDYAKCRHSVAGQSTTNSRFTSWTNSTTAGTWSTRPDDDDQNESVDECGKLTRSDSVSTLRKATSFFGRPIKSKLRKPSKAELRSSEASADLYTALQERINPSESASQIIDVEQLPTPKISSDLATLPSQQRAGSSISNHDHWQAPTIRSVTPDVFDLRVDKLSPVTEVLSPNTALQHFAGESTSNGEQSDLTPRSRLQRRPAIKAPTPSKEQIARRIERSKNRWQSPLDELSPPPTRHTRVAMEDNPYELRSLSRNLHQPTASNGLPHHAKVNQESIEEREKVVSPSIYSRATDGLSPQSETCKEAGETMITITGHEVMSYSISPKKPDVPAVQSVRPSHEWRRWLSDELRGWNSITTAQELMLPNIVLKDTETSFGNASPDADRIGFEDRGSSDDSNCPAPEATASEHKSQRRKAKSRPPSVMNDRYPMLETGRNLSDKPNKRASWISSRAGNTPGSMESSETSSARNGQVEPGISRPVSVISTARAVTKHQSMGQLKPVTRRSATPALATYQNGKAGDNASDLTSLPPANARDDVKSQADPTAKFSNKSKSAFDLRANYRNSASGRAKPLPVRRTPDTNTRPSILEDSTIQNISAGPYASQVPVVAPSTANKENTPPSETNSLPALSSSEWLAAGTYKIRGPRKASGGPSANGSRSVSRYSPSKAVTPGSLAGGGGSPGQRLVTDWLSGKSPKENSPAFV